VVCERKAELAEYVAAALSGADFPFARWNVVADL
jgi:hypothetical protein